MIAERRNFGFRMTLTACKVFDAEAHQSTNYGRWILDQEKRAKEFSKLDQ